MIEEREGAVSVRAACRALGLSTSAYYEWRGRSPSAREVEDRRLAVEVRAIHRESRQTYGARRVHAELRARGVACCRHQVGRLMRENGPVARGPRRKPPRATPSMPLTPVADNVLNRTFEPTAPDRVWTADITYVPTDEGWLYLAVVDLSSRRVGRPPVARARDRHGGARGCHPGSTSGPRSHPPLRSGDAVHVGRLPGAPAPPRGRLLDEPPGELP